MNYRQNPISFNFNTILINFYVKQTKQPEQYKSPFEVETANVMGVRRGQLIQSTKTSL